MMYCYEPEVMLICRWWCVVVFVWKKFWCGRKKFLCCSLNKFWSQVKPEHELETCLWLL